MAADNKDSEAVERASHLRAMQQQLAWLQSESQRLKEKSHLIDDVIETLRQRISKFQSGD